MRKSRFTEEQIIKMLKEHAAGLSAGQVYREYGISDATFYKLLALDASMLKEILGNNFCPACGDEL